MEIGNDDRELTFDELDLVGGAAFLDETFLQRLGLDTSLSANALMHFTSIRMGFAAVAGAATGVGR
jgi:hypothetical protein